MHRPHHAQPRRNVTRAAAVAAALLVGLVSTTFGAAPASAGAAIGYVRLAHLSPDTPKVDVYLNKVGDASFAQQIFRHVGYGTSSKYLPLPVGTYSVAMRAENDPADKPPVITTDVTVNDGGAYTVAGVGKFAGLGLKVLTDDLSRPTGGKAKVRVVQASIKAPSIDVSLPDGTIIGTNIAFASTTDYQLVTPGTWTLRLQPKPAGSIATLSSTLAAGSVYSLLVLDGTNGLKLVLIKDASGGATAPNGGVETGAGGEAAPVGGSGFNSLSLIAVGVALVGGLVVLAVRLRTLANRRR